MKRLLALALLSACSLVHAVNRTGQNSVKIPLSPSGVRISCPECTQTQQPPPGPDLTVCSSGCDYANTTAGISSAIAAVGNGGIIEFRAATPGGTEEWASRIICNGTDGTNGGEKQIRVRDGDTITLDTSTSADTPGNAGLLDFYQCDYWIISGNSTGSGTNYLTNGLRIGDRTRWSQSCILLCFSNQRSINVVASTHLVLRNLSATGGRNVLANLIDGASDLVYLKNVVFDLHGTNNDGTDDSGDLTRFHADHFIVEDGTFSHGGHQGLAARGPHQIFRRVVANGDWTDKSTGWSGNHAGNLNAGNARNDFAGAASVQTAYGPFLVEDSVFTGMGYEPQHSNWNQVTEFWGVGGIMRSTYGYGQNGVGSWFTQCSPSGAGSYLNDYMDAHAILYNNTIYGSVPYTGGGNAWKTITPIATGICEKMNVFNNVFQGVPTNTKSGSPYAWDEFRANIPIDSYPNAWKGSRIMGNIFGGPSTAMQFNLRGTGSGTVSVTDCTKWPSNVCNNLNTNLKFANGTTTPEASKGGLALDPTNTVGLGDALALTTVASTSDSTHMVLTEPYFFKDAWGFDSYTFGGLHTEYGDCIAVSPTSGGSAATAVSTRITSINYSTGAIVVTPGVTRTAGSNVWKATDNGDGTCGAVWDNRGAVQ